MQSTLAAGASETPMAEPGHCNESQEGATSTEVGKREFPVGSKVRVAERRERTNGLKEREREQRRRREQDSIETGQRRLAAEKECTLCSRDVEEFDGELQGDSGDPLRRVLWNGTFSFRSLEFAIPFHRR